MILLWEIVTQAEMELLKIYVIGIAIVSFFTGMVAQTVISRYWKRPK